MGACHSSLPGLSFSFGFSPGSSSPPWPSCPYSYYRPRASSASSAPCVFRGSMTGQAVAVKRLQRATPERLLRFVDDIESAAAVQHDNIIRILGYCVDDDEVTPMIVYEFMEGGSLLSRLTFQGEVLSPLLPSRASDPSCAASNNLCPMPSSSGERAERWQRSRGEAGRSLWDDEEEGGEEKGVLSWRVRVEIAAKVADALAFMHDNGTLHRNLKSSNILLTEDMTPKLSDYVGFNFGDASHISRLHGYLDPYFASTGSWTASSDVYSFGIILLEILTGCAAAGGGAAVTERGRFAKMGVGQEEGEEYAREEELLCNWTRPYLESSFPNLPILMDTRLGSSYCQPSAQVIARLADECVNSAPQDRPSMATVASTLRSVVEKEREFCGGDEWPDSPRESLPSFVLVGARPR